MSIEPGKMLHTGINTDTIMLDVETNTDRCGIVTRLKERNVKHIRITDTAELEEVYHFGELIGQGGFGTVMSITDKHTNRAWAVKIVNKSVAGTKMEIVKREIQILKVVQHPHIIHLDKVYESSKKIYLILEKCSGALASIYKERKVLTEQEVRKIIEELTSAIIYLHKNDIVHRDLKLENLLLAKNPEDPTDKLYIKVSDFGLSIVKKGSGYEHMLHECCGTLTYMSPEMITKHSYSQQCDVWAIGVIMYMLLGGRFPFFSNNEQELMIMICKHEPSYSGFTATPEAINLITKMLAKNAAVRITATEIMHHAWMVGKPMKHDSPENVLDMMRLWRADMMMPTDNESDWVSAPQTSRTIMEANRSLGEKNLVQMEPIVECDSFLKTEAPRASVKKQLLRMPKKNIEFSRGKCEDGKKSSKKSPNRV